ncbi:hypothetical protein F5J12DRAFT_269960 [Pisolithus orientalis]|uniref:uncharacterized protein n=1 Tax=Pisolithus orientalis TaxID=936130 RepID=UPI002224A560|nr:uncharacterized protein F5J12DRAFT_269960 [Pisolithus orientalis]KAI5999844.1 hypothetical protein F5J12DRAFT_269960 [Pisolithus orientalis]
MSDISSTTDQRAIINGFVNAIRPCFIFAIADVALSASLFTLFVFLLALSTKESRRRLVFRLNVFAICLVLTTSVLVNFTCGKSILGQGYWLPNSIPDAATAFTVFPPFACDSILLTRLFALYPLSSTPRITLLKIFVFPFCIKCARVVVLILFFIDYVRSAIGTHFNPISHNPYLFAELTMQIADNLYSVSLFLYGLRVRTGLIRRAGRMPARIRRIFYIAAANFVFPLIFNIVLIISITTTQLSVTSDLLLLINNFVTVMGLLCATLWFSRSEWVRTRHEPLADGMSPLTLDLRRVHDEGRMHRIETVAAFERLATPDIADKGSQN